MKYTLKHTLFGTELTFTETSGHDWVTLFDNYTLWAHAEQEGWIAQLGGAISEPCDTFEKALDDFAVKYVQPIKVWYIIVDGVTACQTWEPDEEEKAGGIVTTKTMSYRDFMNLKDFEGF
jgi:hypothetical protein